MPIPISSPGQAGEVELCFASAMGPKNPVVSCVGLNGWGAIPLSPWTSAYLHLGRWVREGVSFLFSLSFLLLLHGLCAPIPPPQPLTSPFPMQRHPFWGILWCL